MTSTLLLLLKGPMQSWGDSSRYRDRATEPFPSKSGVLGLVAAAQGRRRHEPIEDLAGLRFAVRIDQPGSILRDYQTAQRWQQGGSTSLVTRYYLGDAVFVAAVECQDDQLAEDLHTAISSPRFPLFLGRRSCPASVDLDLGVRHAGAVEALRSEPWHASSPHRRTRPRNVVLPVYRDGVSGEEGIPHRDVPVSFDQAHRRYDWRTVVREEDGVPISNEDGTTAEDPFFEAVVSA